MATLGVVRSAYTHAPHSPHRLEWGKGASAAPPPRHDQLAHCALSHTQACGPAVFNNASLKAAVHAAFQFWQGQDFQNSNWWW